MVDSPSYRRDRHLILKMIFRIFLFLILTNLGKYTFIHMYFPIAFSFAFVGYEASNMSVYYQGFLSIFRVILCGESEGLEVTHGKIN